MDPVELPPTMDCAPEFCFCGRKTVESHEFWFCSTKCARLDSLRSLDNPKCHYRNVVQAYVQAGAPPRRMVSADNLHPGPSDQRCFVNKPLPLIPPEGNAIFTPGATNVVGFPTLSQVTGKILTKKATAGEPLVAERHDRPRWEGFPNATSRARPVNRNCDHAFEPISLDAIPLPNYVPARTLRRVPTSIGSLRDDAKRSDTASLNVERSQQVKEGKDPERTPCHPVSPIIPPARKESLPSHGQTNPPSKTIKALRRSASLSSWNVTSRHARVPFDEQDTLMHIIKEMREELSESFDPKSLFDQEEDY